MPERRASYLGDSVYAEIKEDMIKLTTNNGYDDTNTIYLEPAVYRALIQFAKREEFLSEDIKYD